VSETGKVDDDPLRRSLLLELMKLSNVRTRTSSPSCELRTFRDESRRSVKRRGSESDEEPSESRHIVVDDHQV